MAVFEAGEFLKLLDLARASIPVSPLSRSFGAHCMPDELRDEEWSFACSH